MVVSRQPKTKTEKHYIVSLIFYLSVLDAGIKGHVVIRGGEAAEIEERNG